MKDGRGVYKTIVEKVDTGALLSAIDVDKGIQEMDEGGGGRRMSK